MRDRSIVGEVSFVEIVFLEKRNDRTRFKLIMKGIPEAKERFMMFIKVGRSADRHCLRRDEGMGSRYEIELDERVRYFIFRDQRESAEYARECF